MVLHFAPVPRFFALDFRKSASHRQRQQQLWASGHWLCHEAFKLNYTLCKAGLESPKTTYARYLLAKNGGKIISDDEQKTVFLLCNAAIEARVIGLPDPAMSITGMICNGGKHGRTMKGVVAVDAAWQAVGVAMQDVFIYNVHRITDATPEETMRNMGRIAFPGMVAPKRPLRTFSETKRWSKEKSPMDKSGKIYKTYVQTLKEELIPAMGCTEPIAIAYAAAKAREVLGCEPDLVKIGVSNNIIKNVKSVVVPNTDGMKGIEAAAVAGILGGNAAKELEVISEVTANQKAAMRRFLSNVPISVEAIDNGIIFDIIIALYCGTDSAVVRISQYHTNIVYIKKNDEVLLDNTARQTSAACNTEAESGLTDRSLLTIANIYDFAETCDLDDVRPLLDTQILYNTQISEEGLLGDYGANVGSTYLKFYGNDVRNRAIAKAAAGSDARMSGCELPVVINSGSGNQGITVSVPVIEYAKALACPKERLYRALVLSNLIAIHEKTGIGRLSAYCGAVSAGCAAGCAIAYLQGADLKAVSHTLVNALAIVSGIICDGAKPSCAAKIASSVEAGILGYHMYQNGQQFRGGDGIVSKGVENTIRNIGMLGHDGMRETDKEIVKIMMQKP